MGPDEKTPSTFFITDPATGDKIEVPREIAEMTLALCGDDMGEAVSHSRGCCYGCDHSDGTRRQGDKIRCKRWSQWVDPMHDSCSECTFSVRGTLTEKQKTKIRKLLGD